jgi:ribosomal protein S18 acetylase RimI-like enzyme
VEQPIIREATGSELKAVAELIVRMKKLNEEFDPHFKVVDDIHVLAEKYVQDSMGTKGILLLVALREKKIVGVLRAEVRQRVFYEPINDGRITDFYILPEERRKTLGNEMLEKATAHLKQMGARLITAEFPSQNEIATKFYSKRGFRALGSIHAREKEP